MNYTLCGWKTLYCPKAIAYHVRGGSTENGSDFVKFLLVRNNEFFYQKTFYHKNVQVYCFKKAINLIRYFTIEKKLRVRAKSELKEKEQSLRKKRDYFQEK